MDEKSPLWKDPLVAETRMRLATPDGWRDYQSMLETLKALDGLDAETLTATLVAAEEDDEFLSVTRNLYPEKAAQMIEIWQDFWNRQDASTLFLRTSDAPLKVSIATIVDDMIYDQAMPDKADSYAKHVLDLGLQMKTDGYVRKLPERMVEALSLAMQRLAPLVTNKNVEKNLQDVAQLLMSDLRPYIQPLVTAPGAPHYPPINLN